MQYARNLIPTNVEGLQAKTSIVDRDMEASYTYCLRESIKVVGLETTITDCYSSNTPQWILESNWLHYLLCWWRRDLSASTVDWLRQRDSQL